MSDSDAITHLQRLMKIYQRYLYILEDQAGSYGGENMVPVSVKSQLLDMRAQIAELETKLNPGSARAGAKVPATDVPAVASPYPSRRRGRDQQALSLVQ